MIGLESELNMISQVIDYAGQSKRQGELYMKNNFLLKKGKQLVSNMFMQEPEQNVFLQHKPYLTTLVE